MSKFDWNEISMQAYEAMQRGAFAEAYAVFCKHFTKIERFGKRDARLAYACFCLGSCLYQLEDFQGAEPYCRRAATIYDPVEPLRAVESLYWQGLCFYRQERYRPGARIFEKAIARLNTLTSGNDRWLCEMHVFAAKCIWLQGIFDRAEEHFRQALKVAPREAVPLSSCQFLSNTLATLSAEEPKTKQTKTSTQPPSLKRLITRAELLIKGKQFLLAPPPTRTVDHSDDYFGTTVSDPYRWLEETNSPETRNWQQAQTRHARDLLDNLPGRSQIRERVWEFYRHEAPFLPYYRAGFYYFPHRPLDKSRLQLLRTKKLGHFPEVILDGNNLPEHELLSGTWISSRGRYLAYGRANKGSDAMGIYIKDLETGKHLKDKIPSMQCLSLLWDNRDNGFFYCGMPKGELTQKIWYHRLGTRVKEDRILYQHHDPRLFLSIHAICSGNALLVSIRRTDSEKQSYLIIWTEQKRRRLQIMIPEQRHRFSYCGEYKGRLYFITDKNAPKGRLISLALSPDRTSIPPLREELPERRDVLKEVVLCKGTFVGIYRTINGDKILRLRAKGRFISRTPVPSYTTVYGFGVDNYPELFLQTAGFTSPESIYKFNRETGKMTLLRAAGVPGNDQAEFSTRLCYAVSRDGTRVPYYLCHKGRLRKNASNPVLLTGYGGFNLSMAPNYDRYMMTWMEMGGIFVKAVLRGGGEFGRQWRDDGMLQKKQNTFDDFIAVAEHLLEKGITIADRLGISGTSNGGLLMAAALTQRPELFGCAIIKSAVLDMLRFHHFDLGRYWVSEYGCATDKIQFTYLHAYSPLHRIEKTSYPPTLIAAATDDDRVTPAHSYKFAARLQAHQAEGKPILLCMEEHAGHSGHHRSNQALDEICFLAYALGIVPEHLSNLEKRFSQRKRGVGKN